MKLHPYVLLLLLHHPLKRNGPDRARSSNLAISSPVPLSPSRTVSHDEMMRILYKRMKGRRIYNKAIIAVANKMRKIV